MTKPTRRKPPPAHWRNPAPTPDSAPLRKRVFRKCRDSNRAELHRIGDPR